MHEVRPRDCVIHTADHFEHTFVAGPDGLEYLVFGTRHPTEFALAPALAARSASAGRGSRAGTTTRGTSRPPARRSRSATRSRGPRTSSTSTRSSSRARATRPGRASTRTELAGSRVGADRAREDGLGPALPLRGGGDLRDPRGLGDARTSGRRRAGRARRASASSTSCGPGHVVARPPGTGSRTHFIAGDEGCTMLDLRHAQAERHVLLPALEQDRVARPRRDRPRRASRLLGRRAERVL